mgnify:FL=1
MMNSTRFLPLILIALAGCNAQPGDGGKSVVKTTVAGETLLDGARIGGAFTLTDQDGKPRSWSDFDGQYRLVYFGYTYCPDVCPLDLQHIAQGLRLFEKAAPGRAAKVQPIFITVDPERDTPAVIKNYGAAFHPRLVGLTGTPEQIATVAKSFAVVYSKEQPKGATDYLIGHTRTPYLFGPKGEPLVMLPVAGRDGAGQATKEQIAAVLDRWVK